MDSTRALELVGFLEERFGGEVPNEELAPKNIDSSRNIVSFLCRKFCFLHKDPGTLDCQVDGR